MRLVKGGQTLVTVVALLTLGIAPARVAGQTPAQSTPPWPERYLQSLGLGAAQLRAAAGGQVVVKLLNTEDNRDVAVFGMIAVPASRDAVVARALDVQGFIATRASRSGVFGNPPSAADVRDLAFDRSEYRDLRKCRPGDCDFKLSASVMRSFVDSVNWSAPNAKAQADERLRSAMLHLIADYRSRGNAALLTYDDGPSVHSGDAFDAVLAQAAPTLSEYASGLDRYLTTYPSGRPDGAHDFVSWSEQRLARMRPTLMVNHVVVAAPPTGTAFVARKLIYASHFFEAGLELLAIMETGAAGTAPATYLITVRRFRFDYLPGGILNVRGRVRSHLVDATRADLLRERAAIQETPAPPGR